MRLRWNFHRLMLRQPMAFYQDEFAGRLTTKVMQTALAVRDAIFVVADVLVTMAVYVVTMIVAAGTLRQRTDLAVPRLGRPLYRAACLVRPAAGRGRQGAGRCPCTDDRPRHRCLYQHRDRQAVLARPRRGGLRAPGDAGVHGPGLRQMRLVSLFEISNHTLWLGLTAGIAGTALWLWTRGAVGSARSPRRPRWRCGCRGCRTGSCGRRPTCSRTSARSRTGSARCRASRRWSMRPDAAPLVVPRGEIRFEHVSFRYGPAGRPVIDDLSLVVRAGERIGLVGRSGAGKSTLVNLLLRFHDLEQRPHPDRRPGHRRGSRRIRCARRSAW